MSGPKQLEDRLADDLARSGLTLEQAHACGLFAVDCAADVYPEFSPVPALVIPYYNADGTPLIQQRHGEDRQFCRVRYFTPPLREGSKPRRYDQPRYSGVRAYFPPNCDWKTVFDLNETIFITEGEKKALAGCAAHYPTIGLGGVYNFREQGALLAELEAIPWRDRIVYIVYDSDYVDNPNIRVAADRIASMLGERGADVRLVSLPPGPQDENGVASKVGLDDYLVTHDATQFEALLKAAPSMNRLTQEIYRFNGRYAFIEGDGMIYDFATHGFLSQTSFLSGSDAAKHHVQVTSTERNVVKNVSVAREWLKHPAHRVYRDTVFDPTTLERSIERPSGGVSLNTFTGLPDAIPGDVKPFFDLYNYLFSKLPPKQRDIALKLITHKLQNPSYKASIALVILGIARQRTGKSLFCDIVRSLFGPYGKTLRSEQLCSSFNAWIENALCITIQEVDPEHVAPGSSGAVNLKTYIADKTQFVRPLYREGRDVNNYAMFILTSNSPEAALYEEGDARMFVIPSPPRHPDGEDFYAPIYKWYTSGGPDKLRHWMLQHDLQGWKPPDIAPVTAEKRIALAEGRTPVENVARRMLDTPGDSYIVSVLDMAMTWAVQNEMSSNPQIANTAKHTIQALMTWPIRPYYTAEELRVMLPEIASGMSSGKLKGTPAGAISKQLRSHGIPYLVSSDNPDGFRWRGNWQQYLVVSHFSEYEDPMSQAEFERQMANFGTYGELRRNTHHLPTTSTGLRVIRNKQEDVT